MRYEALGRRQRASTAPGWRLSAVAFALRACKSVVSVRGVPTRRLVSLAAVFALLFAQFATPVTIYAQAGSPTAAPSANTPAPPTNTPVPPTAVPPSIAPPQPPTCPLSTPTAAHARGRRYRRLLLAPTPGSAAFYRRAGFAPVDDTLLALDP